VTPIVVDACCLINLAAADAFSTWLPQMGLAWILPRAVADEALFLRAWSAAGEPVREAIDLRPHIASGLFDVVAPRGAVEIAAFVRYARALDDGEAMALAIAECRGWMLAIDDRKAVAAVTAAKVPVCSTPDLIKRWVDTAAVEDCEINSILSRIKQRARYLPGLQEPLFDWWLGYLSDSPRG
jgi:hypothetical protein